MKFLFHDKLTNDTTWVESVNGCKKKILMSLIY